MKSPETTPSAEEAPPHVRRAQLALGIIVFIVLAVNFALFLAMSERDAKKRAPTLPNVTNNAPTTR